MKRLVFSLLLTGFRYKLDCLRSVDSAVFWNAFNVFLPKFVLSSRDLEYGFLKEKIGFLQL